MVILTLFFIFVTFFLQNTCKYHFFFCIFAAELCNHL